MSEIKQEQEIKPCPFCGSEAKVSHQYTERREENDYRNTYEVGCLGPRPCHGKTSYPHQYRTEDAAIEAWNTRSQEWVSVEENRDVFGSLTIKGEVKSNGYCVYRGHYILKANDSAGEFYLCGVADDANENNINVLRNIVQFTTRSLNDAIQEIDEIVESKIIRQSENSE